MAAPLIVALPAIFSALWSGLLVCLKWLVDHLHTVKIAVIAAIMLTCYRLGISAYKWLVAFLNGSSGIGAIRAPSGASAALDIMAKANYVLPLDEALTLLSAYISLAGVCIVIRAIISSYRNVPFKSA